MNSELRPLKPFWRASAAALFFLASMSALVLLTRQVAPSIALYVAALAGGSALVSLTLWRTPEISTRTVLLVAVVGHAIALFGQTIFEDDYYRFLWDGWRVLESGTPYGIPPQDFIDDSSVSPDMQGVLEWINYPYYPTIYGPTLQVLFAATYAVFGSNELGLRLLFAVGALVLSALIMRRYSPGKAALFAWNPVVVAESTLHLHPDILLGLFLFAGVMAGRDRPILAGLLIGIATGVKVVAFAAWPILLRLAPAALISAVATLAVLYGFFALQGLGVGLDSTETFAKQWHFNPQVYQLLFSLFGPTWGRLITLAIAGLIVVWLHASSKDFESVPLAAIFGIILLFAPAVNVWYLMWLLPFAVGRREIWPYIASAALPLSYLTGLNLELYEFEDFEVHPIAHRAEWLLIGAAMLFDIVRHWKGKRACDNPVTPIATPQVSVVIPALNEAGSVGKTVQGILAANPSGLSEVIVADNGSTDETASEAKAAGAKVTAQPERGYGAACLAALKVVDSKTNIILFMDADLSDVPEEAERLLAPIIAGEADLVIGSRAKGQVEKGAMSMPQRFGNWLAPTLVRFIWGVRYTDLGPFRAIERSAFERLLMADRDFGWTIEMQVRAAKLGLRITERPVNYRKRVGVSKISGTLRGVFAAGWKILFVIAREAFGDFDQARRRSNRKQPSLL